MRGEERSRDIQKIKRRRAKESKREMFKRGEKIQTNLPVTQHVYVVKV